MRAEGAAALVAAPMFLLAVVVVLVALCVLAGVANGLLQLATIPALWSETGSAPGA